MSDMAGAVANLPYLKQTGGVWELYVDDRRYLILGGELQNSSMSSARHMTTVWQDMVDLGVNTVLGAVSWEDIKQEEGRFDFAELDAVLDGARQHGLRIILLWFGAYKNGQSSYVPSWVKLNPDRFPRMEVNVNGETQVSQTLSVFHRECSQADAKAFAVLMAHLRDSDTTRTVIMVQVENEVGLLRDSRDRSAIADKLFSSSIPIELRDYLWSDYNNFRPELKENFPGLLDKLSAANSQSSWEDIFGKGNHTDEIFMAYHYAHFVEKVTASGKEAYDIPIFTNVWQPKVAPTQAADGVISGGRDPGDYPSGGAVPCVLDIWLKFAPTLSFIAPDIHSADYTNTCETYCHRGQALFVPEQKRDESGARRIWQNIGRFGGLGAGPFGVDTLEAKSAELRKHYKLLGSVSQLILKARTSPESIYGFFFDEMSPEGEDPNPPFTKRFGEYQLRISRAFVFGKPGPGFGIIIESAPGEFILIGMGYKVEFESLSPDSYFTGILENVEKSVVDASKGLLLSERKLNGDETRQGRWANMPNENPDLAGYTPICIPARTMIAMVKVYSLKYTSNYR